MVKLFDRYNFMEKLRYSVRQQYEPKKASVEELVENVLCCYETDNEDSQQSYFKIENDKYKDIMEYINFCGGFKVFDFVV